MAKKCTFYLTAYNVFSINVINTDIVDNIFTAQVTIAVLSGTVITIITSSLSENYYGFTLKEIVGFDKLTVKFNVFLLVEFLNIIVSSVAMSYNLLNLISSVFLFTILLVIYYGRLILKSILNTNYGFERILHRIDSINFNVEVISVSEKLFNSFIKELKDYSLHLGSEKLKQYTALINNLLNINDKLNLKIDLTEYMKKIVDAASKEWGFNEAIKLIDSFYGETEDFLDKRTILSIPIDRIRFYNDLDLYNSRIPNAIEYIDLIEGLQSEDKIYLLYNYFINLRSNSIISKDYKESLQSRLINGLAHFYNGNQPNNLEKESVIYHIIKNIALLEADEELFAEIIYELNIENEYFEEGSFSSIIADICLLLYSCSFKETEIFSDEFRDRIKSFNLKKKSSINSKQIDLNTIVLQYKDSILKSIGSKLLNEKESNKYECYSGTFRIKNLIWTEFTLNSTFFYFFIIFIDDIFYDSPIDYIEHWTEFTVEEKFKILSCFIRFFDPIINSNGEPEYKLTAGAVDEINLISNWLNYQSQYANRINELGFNINKKLEEALAEKINATPSKKENVESINKELTNLLQADNLIWFDNFLEIDDDSGTKFINPFVFRREAYSDESMAFNIKQVFFSYVNDYIMKTLPIRAILFNEKGVPDLLEAIRNNQTVDSRNFTFTNYWWPRNLSGQTEAFKELEETNNRITNTITNKINVQLYFKMSDFAFNIKIDSVKRESLTIDQVDKFTESFKTPNGLYNIDGAFVNKSTAMKLVANIYESIRISFKFVTKLNCHSGFVVQLKKGNLA